MSIFFPIGQILDGTYVIVSELNYLDYEKDLDWVKEAMRRIEGIMAVEDTASMTELGGRQLQLNDEWKQKVETLVRNMNSDNTLKPTFMTSQRKQGALQYLREIESDIREEMLSRVNAIDWNNINRHFYRLLR